MLLFSLATGPGLPKVEDPVETQGYRGRIELARDPDVFNLH